MSAWNRFRERLKQGDDRYHILAAIQELEKWLDLPFGEALIEAQKVYSGCTEAKVTRVFQGLIFLRLKLLRDAGITGDDAELNRRTQQLFALCAPGGGSPAERQLALRLANSLQISNFLVQSYPSLVQPVTAESAAANKALVDAVGALFPTFSSIMRRSQAGSDLEQNIDGLLQLKTEFNKIAQTANTAFQTKFISDQRARCSYWLALNHALLQHAEESRAEYLEAASWFEKAEAPREAVDCRKRARNLMTGFNADTDQAIRDSLEALLNRAGEDDPLARVEALSASAESMGAAGDHFEAARISAQVVAELKKWNLLDPQEVGFDRAIGSWIENLPERFVGSGFFRAFFTVHNSYLAVLERRSGDRSTDAARREKAFRLVMSDKAESDELDVVTQASRENLQAETELANDWAPYLPPGSSLPPAPPPLKPEETEHFNRASGLLELAWNALRTESGSRDSTDPQEDLIARAIELENQAKNLNLDFFNAKAKMTHAEVLIRASRPKDAVPLLDEARALILGAKPIAYGTYAGSAERDVCEMILRFKCMAQAMAGDLQGWSDTCEEAIRSIEKQRYLINSPERQNAFLDWRADFYVYGVAAARKLKNWDAMLERMELIKAHSIIRSRLVPSAPELDATDLAEKFREVSDQIQAARNPEALSDLTARRRQLWDLMSIARARRRNVADPPEINLRNLQKTLQADEVIVAYFWQTGSVLLAMVIDQEKFNLERIEFSNDDLSLYSDFIDALQKLESFNGGMDDVARELGELLLPRWIRDSISGKARLIISPHRTLHLFPFQATVWDDRFLGQRFAIRYVPNLSSLLLPWRTSAKKQLLALGISHFKVSPFDDNPLPLAEAEARNLVTTYEDKGIEVEVLCGAEASRARFRDLRENKELAKFRWLHLATHGTSVFQESTLDHPMESQLILYDGWLDGLEIAELSLEADLVVLSACSSGQRALSGRGLKELPGDDVFGLQSALFSSGVRSVLGALWPLKDEQAFDLVGRFHSHFASGQPADKSLQLAVNGYLDENPRREIFYWAPFFLSTLGTERQDTPEPLSA